MFGSFGAAEIIIIAFVLILLFGGKKIPELAKGIGKGIKDFRKSIKDREDEDESEDDKKIEKD
ncbi:MAG: twin-arginine translocase TatA/TatE family subunit [Melioribacteraceae bacterium]|nr:twin-arginine translocase TatA/TatE family subunit [Melioribacteraceae bacterium]MCF8354118.1 twin-arginine translocase TatA/TatE family subunit [Melioribacteraceae bacterium]MCF8393345.1 twin-arginine translocase TatA/TatE family subunit [Melioribacteraceae bacterium]MCF8418910.1 twin-arginine translocase TatA/TatE family subunit [Melioribacteraceae bacterium]